MNKLPVDFQGTENGCSVAGDAAAMVEGEVPSATVSVGGTCYNKVTTSDQAQFLAVGTISIGQCYNAFQVPSPPPLSSSFFQISASHNSSIVNPHS